MFSLISPRSGERGYRHLNMDWQHPQSLYLILPLCVAWLALAMYSDRQRRRARESFVAQAMWSRILPTESRLRFWMKLTLREVAIVMGLVALAGPQFGMQYEQVVPRGSDLYVLIDVSRSMLASDVPPSRLERAKLDVSALINRLEGERVGLIAFAGQAVVKCPLTVDYDSFRRALEELNPDSAPRGGTTIGDAIRKALEVFQAKADRDQAVLLITDGDDQQSYPLEAAAVAAERQVTIFTVGLGDTEKGARIPQKGDANNFVEYQGEQVWSKLNGNLLQEIALKTSGVYIPVSTRAYDLAELYVTHLQGKRGNDSASQQRIRRAEQFQWFLAIALAALLIDLCLSPYRRALLTRSVSEGERFIDAPTASSLVRSPVKRSPSLTLRVSVLALIAFGSDTLAAEPRASVRDGLSLYANEKYDAAREKFSAASEELDKQKSPTAAIAAFDEACAWHRQGDLEKARDAYLLAGLSQDRSLATAAHFNLGTLAAEHARKLTGEQPEAVPVEKRQEILDQLKQAIVAYRHCLELQPEHSSSRRNLELVRQWIKYYSEKWREHDRQKRRDESNLIAFLEYLIQTQGALRETAKHLPITATADAFAELKRAQEELREEIPTLLDKIAHDLKPQTPPGGATTPQPNSKEIDEGIALLQGWADTAEQKMSAAASRLSARKPDLAIPHQQAAIDELDKIWDAVIPFHPLLAKDLADQTAIARTLNPTAADDKPPESPSNDKTADEQPTLEIADDDFLKLADTQERTLKRTRLLVPKAEAELQQLENAPAANPPANEDKPEDGQAQPPQVDPEQAKAGFRKAIELAPQAVEQQESAVEALKKKDHPAAAQHAEAARKILEEIQQAQPKNNQQDQQKKDDDKSQDENEDQKKNEPKPDDKKPDDQKSDDKKDEPQKKEDSKQQQKQQQQQVSSDRLEDALRKVRERQQEKRERDRKLKAQILGRAPVDKDW